MVGILLSYWGGIFSGAMLVSGRVVFEVVALGLFAVLGVGLVEIVYAFLVVVNIQPLKRFPTK